MSNQPIVRVANLHKFFKRGSEQIDVLNNLSLEVPQGEFLALMGPSGSGKTTLLNLIAGLDQPSEGRIMVGEEEISAMSEAQLAKWRTRSVGFIFQFYNLLPVLTAYENVELPLLLLPLSRPERKRQVETALDLVGLSNRMSHRPGQLSGGQQQRVGIARAIVTDPTLIVADEPTGDLDTKSGGEILDLMIALKDNLNKTILMVTHDPHAAERAQRTLHLEKGRLVDEVRQSKVAATPTHDGIVLADQVREAPRSMDLGVQDMYDSKKWLTDFLANPLNPIGAVALALIILFAATYWEYTRFMFKSLRRNMLRSILTGLATAFLVLMVTLIWSVLAFIDRQTEAKSKDLKVIVSEKYQLPSQMPFAYYDTIAQGAPQKPGDYQINPDKDAMYWAFYGGTIDPDHKTRDNTVFFFSMDPRKLISYDANGKFSSMMEDIDQVPDDQKKLLAAACEQMEKNPKLVLIGASRLEAMHKKVGEKIKVTSFNYAGIDLEFEILGELPRGRYEQSAVMNYQYLANELDSYKRKNNAAHPMADKTLALVWLRVPNMATFEKVSHQLSTAKLGSTAIKCETASSGIASFLDAYKNILWGMRWLMGPAILATMSLVIANAISISVRERRVEMAILKVLGFSPNQILMLVLGEALLIGCIVGLFSAWATLYLVNELVGGVSLPIAFFGKFFVESAAPWWGLAVGAGTAFLGSIVPAWGARSVKVTDVFSKIA